MDFTIDSPTPPPEALQDISIIPGFCSSNAPASPASAQQRKPSSSASPQQQNPYGEIPAIPVLDAIDGVKFDFNHGIRILFPKNGKEWRVVFSDLDTGVTLYRADATPGAFVTSVKKFYIRFRLELFEKNAEKPAFVHDFDATDRDVLIQLPVGTIGDSIGWFSYVERFQKKHRCRLLCSMEPRISELFRDQYPDIRFLKPEEVKDCKPYATYRMGLFFKGDVDNQPIDFRYIGLHRTAGYILGVDPADEPPRFNLSAPRRIKEKYVCIAAQSSSQAKYWNNPFGWIRVVEFLKENGYRVLCIDRDKVYGTGLVWNYIPYGSEDFTGPRPLQERIDLIKDADFFIGLSSGLSWLAWGCKVPVVMISGFTHPTNEFATPYRIINYHACHSCWNDMREDFDHFDFLWCPRRKGTDRQFECTRLISAEQVINVVKTIPTFRPGPAKESKKSGK